MSDCLAPSARLISSCFCPLGLGDQGALLALGGDLLLHRAQDGLGRGEILQLVAQHFHAPRAARFIQHRDDRAIDGVARLQGAIELHLADLGAQGRLCDLRDRQDVVRGAVGTPGADR